MENLPNARYCIVGAGAAGLAAAKNFKQAGIPFDLFEREDDVGGNWYYGRPHSSVYRSTHLISSKRFTQYPDFPMPDDYPVYPNHAQALEYLRAYARTFGLYACITFNRSVKHAEPVDGGKAWRVTLDDGEVRVYSGLVVATGHLWNARQPVYPGSFNGEVLHSSQYKTPDVLLGKRVLVVGAGNSGCDIAVESALNAARTFHSTRRGYFYWPKFMFGMPSDEFYELVLKLRLPLKLRRLFGALALKLVLPIDPSTHGIPRPDHQLFESHFIINSSLLYHLAHGDITMKPDVAELRGERLAFADGSEEQIDVIVFATGFTLIRFPFLDDSVSMWRESQLNLVLNIAHKDFDNVFFVGLFQTSTGNWPLMDYQSQLVSRWIVARQQCPDAVAQLRRELQQQPPDVTGGIGFQRAARHQIEVEHFAYRATLKKLISRLDSVTLRAA